MIDVALYIRNLSAMMRRRFFRRGDPLDPFAATAAGDVPLQLERRQQDHGAGIARYYFVALHIRPAH